MYGQNVNLRIGGPLTPVVKKLLIINAAIFIAQLIIGRFYPGLIESLFGLHHVGFVQELKLWQILTYMFLHGGWFHILFNLLTLWMFAGEIEQLWGSNVFLRYYMITGIGAGVFIIAMNYFIYLHYQINPVTIGASGAIYGILLAYGMTWPDRKVLLYFVIPVKIKYLVLAFGCIEFFGLLSSATEAGGNISHIGHLGGLITGFIYIFTRMRGRTYFKSGDAEKKESIFMRAYKKVRLKKKKKEIETRIQSKKIIDELLEKIARHGMSSLTAQEKSRLEWARKHYYPDRDETLH